METTANLASWFQATNVTAIVSDHKSFAHLIPGILDQGAPNQSGRQINKAELCEAGSQTDVIVSARRAAGNRKSSTYFSVGMEHIQGNEPSSDKVHLYWLETTVMLKITEMEAQKVNLHLTTKIVRSYVGHHAIDADQVSELITSVHGAVSQLRWSKEPEEVPTPAVPVRQSVQHDDVVCLDCGFRGKMLRRHISKRHGLRRNEYLNAGGCGGIIL